MLIVSQKERDNLIDEINRYRFMFRVCWAGLLIQTIMLVLV